MSALAPTLPILVTAPPPGGSRPPRLPLSLKPNKPRLLPPLRCAPPPVHSPKPSDPSFHPLNPLPFTVISGGILFLNAFLKVLPGNFSGRWRRLVEFSKGAETKVTEYPYHLVQAVMASEDRRFFYHFGVDPYGVARAVVYYPNGGGGSTLTQQLVKNVFLTAERKISRKFVEGILSLIVERKLSKWQILYSYLHTMYWGHGKYGIEAASLFYFGKHPSLLNIGESALLAGILPSPETLNPITSRRRGKYSQARVLRRMVANGFLDLETALLIVKQPISLCINQVEHLDKEYGGSKKKIGDRLGASEIWDWEMATIILEAREYMEKWASSMEASSNIGNHGSDWTRTRNCLPNFIIWINN